jgi:hypothetical protein
VDVGRVAERGEDLLAADQEAAVDGLRDRGDPGGGAPAQPLAERLAVQQPALDHAVEQDLAALVEQVEVVAGEAELVGDRAGEQARRGVHVERERRGTAVAAELLGDEGVGDEVGPEPAEAFGHAQPVEAGSAQIGEVLVRERGVAVVLRGPRLERRPELGHAADELTLQCCATVHSPIHRANGTRPSEIVWSQTISDGVS